ncbi:DUF4097 family beta strand repeat-containing protein [Tsukamurella strandjordii]|uniref:DUF4097 family beta strand repeat-containing protein n=1 Tax=Tsukamurella strandjordii TaxID=147577 RepID=UPI0031D8A354
MPTFDTPSPIDLAVNLQVGDLEVVAGDRADTVVTVTPTSPSKEADRRAAESTRVEFDGARVTVVAPKPKFSLFGPSESVDVRVELPAGSRLTAEVAYGGTRSTGRLGATRIKNPGGLVELGDTGALWVRAGHGNATIGDVDGSAEVTADHGQIRVGRIAGDARLKASHGSVRVEETGGAVEANLSYGDLDITRSLGSVTAKTAYGSITLQEVVSGSVEVESGYGQVTVGVSAGTPAWLDLSSKEGRVRNELDGDESPSDLENSVSVMARTKYGDIAIRRAR